MTIIHNMMDQWDPRQDGKKKTLKFPDLSTFQWSPKDIGRHIWDMYPLVNEHSYWKWPFIVDLPINSMVIFHSYGTVYQRVILKCCHLLICFWYSTSMPPWHRRELGKNQWTNSWLIPRSQPQVYLCMTGCGSNKQTHEIGKHRKNTKSYLVLLK